MNPELAGSADENRRAAELRSPSAVFRCRRCGRCCRWHGVVRMNDAEIAAAAALLKMTEPEFIGRWMTLTPDRRGLTLQEEPDGTCVMLTTDAEMRPACRIEAAKPHQCRDFPERWNFPGWEEECAGAAEWRNGGEKR